MNAERAQTLLVREFGRMAEVYDRYGVTGRAPVWRHIRELVPLSSGTRVLDVACGPGAHTVRLARAVGPTGQVLGIDAARGMVDVARHRREAQSLPQLRFRCMDAHRLRLPSQSFDFVLSTFGISYLDRQGCLNEIFRVLNGGGKFLYVTWNGRNRESTAFLEALSDLRRRRPPPPDVLRLSKAREAVTHVPENREGSPKLAVMLHRAGFRSVRRFIREMTLEFPTPSDYVRYQATWGEYYRDLNRLSPGDRRQFVGDVMRRIGRAPGGRGPTVTWELSFTLARKA